MSMTRRNFLGGVLAVALTRPGRALLARQTPNDVSPVTGVDWGQGPDYTVQLQRIGPYTKEWRVMEYSGRYPDAYVTLAYDSTHDEAIGIVEHYRIPREVWQAQDRINRLESMARFEPIVVKQTKGIEASWDWEAAERFAPAGLELVAAAKATAKAWADHYDQEALEVAYREIYGTSRYFDQRTGAEYFYNPTWLFPKAKKEIWNGS